MTKTANDLANAIFDAIDNGGTASVAHAVGELENLAREGEDASDHAERLNAELTDAVNRNRQNRNEITSLRETVSDLTNTIARGNARNAELQAQIDTLLDPTTPRVVIDAIKEANHA